MQGRAGLHSSFQHHETCPFSSLRLLSLKWKRRNKLRQEKLNRPSSGDLNRMSLNACFRHLVINEALARRSLGSQKKIRPKSTIVSLFLFRGKQPELRLWLTPFCVFLADDFAIRFYFFAPFLQAYTFSNVQYNQVVNFLFLFASTKQPQTTSNQGKVFWFFFLLCRFNNFYPSEVRCQIMPGILTLSAHQAWNLENPPPTFVTGAIGIDKLESLLWCNAFLTFLNYPTSSPNPSVCEIAATKKLSPQADSPVSKHTLL